VGIIECKPNDNFTRPQRLICLLCLIFGQFAASAVFFGIDPSNIAMKAIIGIISAIILTPSKLFFKMMFKKSTYRAPLKRRESRGTLAKTRREQLKRGMLVSGSFTSQNLADKIQEEKEQDEARRALAKERRSSSSTSTSTSASKGTIGVDVVQPLSDVATLARKPPGPGVNPQMLVSSMRKTSALGKPPNLRRAPTFGSADFGGIWNDGNKVAPGPAGWEAGIGAIPPMTGRGAAPPPGRPRRRTAAAGGGRGAGAQIWGSAAAAAAAATAFFVAPPPAAGDGSMVRPRRRGNGKANQVSPFVGGPSSSGDGFDGVAPAPPPPPPDAPPVGGSGGAPAPPPLPEGTPVRPRRRTSMIGMAAIQAAANFRRGQMTFYGDGGDQLDPKDSGAGGMALAPPPLAAARPGRPVRKKTRAALLAASGLVRMQAAAEAGGHEDVAAGAVPPPPASQPRPRPGGGHVPGPAPPMSGNFTGITPGVAQEAGTSAYGAQQQTPSTPPHVAERDAQTRLAMLASVSRALQRERPGAGRSRRPGTGPFDVERRKRMVSAVVTQQAAVLGGDAQLMTHYVPEPILRVVTTIQRTWRRKMAMRVREQVRAARVMQAMYRGMRDRQKVALIRSGHAQGDENGRQLWWVSAHAPGSLNPQVVAAEEHERSAKAKAAAVKNEASSRQEHLVGRWMGTANLKLQAELEASEEASKPQAVKDAELQELAKQSTISVRGGLGLPPPDPIRKKRRTKRRKARKSAGKGLPRWFIYVAYVLSFAFCAVAAFFMMLYGITFEPPVARAW